VLSTCSVTSLLCWLGSTRSELTGFWFLFSGGDSCSALPYGQKFKCKEAKYQWINTSTLVQTNGCHYLIRYKAETLEGLVSVLLKRFTSPLAFWDHRINTSQVLGQEHEFWGNTFLLYKMCILELFWWEHTSSTQGGDRVTNKWLCF